jgi:hypothetical protein
MAVAVGLVESGQRVDGRFKRGSVPDNAGSRTSGWISAVREAGIVLDHAPDLADAVLAGDMALDAAHRAAPGRTETAHDTPAGCTSATTATGRTLTAHGRRELRRPAASRRR